METIYTLSPFWDTCLPVMRWSQYQTNKFEHSHRSNAKGKEEVLIYVHSTSVYFNPKRHLGIWHDCIKINDAIINTHTPHAKVLGGTVDSMLSPIFFTSITSTSAIFSKQGPS